MANIATRVFVLGGNQNYLTLANEEFVRQLGIGSTWTKVRVGLFFALTPDSTNNLNTVTLAIGMCSGVSAPFAAASTTNFVGAALCFGGTATYNANSGNPYFGMGLAQYGKRVGNTNTFAAPGGATNIVTNTGTVQRRTPIYIDITKGSPNYTVVGYTPSAGQAIDYSFSGFLDGMEQTATPVVNGVAHIATNGQAFAASESPGGLDTVDFYYNKNLWPMEIYGMAVYRQS